MRGGEHLVQSRRPRVQVLPEGRGEGKAVDVLATPCRGGATDRQVLDEALWRDIPVELSTTKCAVLNADSVCISRLAGG